MKKQNDIQRKGKKALLAKAKRKSSTSSAGSGSISGGLSTAKQKSGKKGCYIINDYGHLVMTENTRNLPWEKVVAKKLQPIEIIPHRMALNKILVANAMVVTIYDSSRKDDDWVWRHRE